MIKSVLQAIPTYIMGCFLIPTSIITMIESVIRYFWWGAKEGRYMVWMAWFKLCLLE